MTATYIVHIMSIILCDLVIMLTGSVSVGHAVGGERVHREGLGVQEYLAAC